jgi:putative ABC transport system substrate-binding protein
MKRRDFLTGLLLTAAGASAQAQQKGKVYRLAVVDTFNPVAEFTEAGELPVSRGFLARLRELGFAEGRNLEITRYSGEGRPESFGGMVAKAVNLKPDVIFVRSTRLLFMFKEATTTIPIVGTMADPVRLGFVKSFARPGGNITGVAHDPGIEFYNKRFELLKEAAPKVSKLGLFWSQEFIEKTTAGAAIKEAAKKVGVEIVVPIETLYWQEQEYRPAFERMARGGVNGIVVGEQNENWAYRRSIIALAEKFQLPAIYPATIFVELGGLISFGVNWEDFGGECARVVAEIFKGANPANIPISQPTKYELTLNQKTAKALGINIPPSLLVQAGKVIE